MLVLSEIADVGDDSFIPPKKVMSREDLMMVVHRAVVEVFTLRDAGRPMTDAANARDDRVVPETSGVRFTISGEEQKVILSYPDEKVKETILQSTVLGEPVQEVMDVQAQAEEAASEAIDGTDTETPLEEVATTPVEEVMPDTDTPPSTQRQTTLPHDSTWLNISLQDPTLKFAVCPPHPLQHNTSLTNETQPADHQTHHPTNRHPHPGPRHPANQHRQIAPPPPHHSTETEETRRGLDH